MNRSALITQRRVGEAWTLLLVIAAMTFTAFILGFVFGATVSRTQHTYRCPQVPGAKVISTSDTKQGQHCLYSDDDYGKAKMKVKL